MKIIDVEQRSPEWLELRKTCITGTRAAEVKPLARRGKTGNQPMGLWQLAAEYISEEDNEPPIERGISLEKENAEKTVAKRGLKSPLYDCGMWKTDDGRLGYSPDASEDSIEPTWAIECKSLSTATHLYLILRDMFALGQAPDEFEGLFPTRIGEYRGIDSVAEEHQYQVRHAFVVNPKLQVVYYSLYDPRVAIPAFQHHVITVRREEMEEDLKDQTDAMTGQAKLARSIAKFIVKYGKDTK